MIRIFKTEDGAMHEKEEMEPGSWIALTNPTASEILEIADACQIDPDHLKAPLDEEERSRIEAEDEYTLILVDIPSIEERNGKDWFVTIPMAIITTKDMLITVCLEETPILTAFMDGRVRDFHTFMKTRFILQILYKNATQYLQYLRIIDKKSEVIENKLHQSQKNEELIELLELQKSLVYFTTSLRSNEVVLEKLLRIDKIKKYPEDTDLLEDVIVENKAREYVKVQEDKAEEERGFRYFEIWDENGQSAKFYIVEQYLELSQSMMEAIAESLAKGAGK